MKFQNQLERVVGFLIMIVAPGVLLVAIGQWLIEDEQRLRAALAVTVGYGIALYLFWRIKQLVTKEGIEK